MQSTPVGSYRKFFAVSNIRSVRLRVSESSAAGVLPPTPSRDAEARARLHVVQQGRAAAVRRGGRSPAAPPRPFGGLAPGRRCSGEAHGRGRRMPGLDRPPSLGRLPPPPPPRASGPRSSILTSTLRRRAPRGGRGARASGSSYGASPDRGGAASQPCSMGSRSRRCRSSAPRPPGATPGAWSLAACEAARYSVVLGLAGRGGRAAPARAGGGGSAGNGLLDARDLTVRVEAKGRGYARAG